MMYSFHKVKHVFCILPTILLALATLSCSQDSWRHYVGGGNYMCNSGSLSPCGKYLVFGSPKSGRGDIWRIHLEDSTRHRITNTEDFESHPRYSPNGESIFYLRENGGFQHIWKTDKDGLSHEQLTFGQAIDTLVDVSPDVDNLMVRRSFYTGGLGLAAGPAMIYSISNKKFIEEEVGSWGRFLDNNTLLYNTRPNADDRTIRFGKYDKETRQRHVFGEGFIESLSPNKKAVLISRDPNRSFLAKELIVFDLDEQSEKRIGTGRYPCFLGDSKVFFVQSSPRRAYIYSLENDTTEEIELPGAIAWTPVATPDGRGILLRLISPNDSDRSGNIYLLNDEGVKKLTQ